MARKKKVERTPEEEEALQKQIAEQQAETSRQWLAETEGDMSEIEDPEEREMVREIMRFVATGGGR